MIHTHKHIHSKGFIALVSVLVLALGMFAFSISAMVAAASYRDAVYTREMRIQKRLDQQACVDTFELMKAKDYFLNRDSLCGEI